MKEKILDDYKNNKKAFHDFRERMVQLLKDLLSEQQIEVHQISSRVKTSDSLSKKIDTKNDKYYSIDEITDIVGVRIITYLESTVDSVSELIEKEFVKDLNNSIDKRRLKSDQFGYRSLHIVVSFNADRCKLKEYKKYNGLKCEVQIRSILQHTWAEIEHDLGYKGELSIPNAYKRSFNRLSALLETADIEFDRLKIELASYQKEVSNLIVTEPQMVDINQTSITSFVASNDILLKAKKIIERKTNIKLHGTGLGETIIKRIKYLGFNTIGEIEKSLILNQAGYLKFVEEFVKVRISENRQVLAIAPLMYFLHYLVAKKDSIEEFKKYFDQSEYATVNEIDFNEYINIYKDSLD